MALQKQIVRMSAEGGLDTKTDEKNVLATNFLELENIRFTKTGAFSKRNGYSAYIDQILNSSSTITTGQAATVFKNELLRYSDTTIYSYAESENKWVNKGDVRFALSSELGVAVNASKNTNPSHDTSSNLTCYVYEKANLVGTDVEYRIVDSVTGSVIYTGTIVSGTSPNVLAILGKFYIFYVISGTIYYCTVNFSTPSLISAPTAVLTTPTINYEVEAIANRAYILTADAATGVNVTFITSAGAVASPVHISDANTYNVYCVSAEQSTSVRITYGKNTSTTLKTVLYNTDLTYQIHAPVSLETAQAVHSIGAIQDPSNVNKSQIYASITTAAPYKLKKYSISSAGTIGTNTILLNQAALQSKPQVYGSKVYFAVSKHVSTYSSAPYKVFRTYFMASEDGALIAKFGNDSGIFRTQGNLPKLNIEGTRLAFCGGEAAEIQANTNTPLVNVPTKIKKYSADFNTLNNYFDSVLGDNLHVSGGILRMYDGTNVVEHNFLLTPEAPIYVSETGYNAGFGTGLLPNKSYQWVVVYAWTDKYGQLHRSAPSLPLTHTTGNANDYYGVTIKVPMLAFTNKQNVEIEVYRTEGNGTVFYKRAYSYADRIANDPANYETTGIYDQMVDSDLIKNETLYTEGGVLENAAADSSKFITTYKGRVFLLGSDGYTVQYSKKREQHTPVEFAEELKITLDEMGGTGTCMGVLDDHIIFFKERAIFALSGEGPNALGEQDDFREPYSVASDVGCSDPNSIVLTPEGLMFKSAKGIYLLRRGLSVEYIGAPVELYNNLTITSASLVPNTNEVRFTTDSDKMLIYDYYHQRWVTDSNINAIDAVVYNGNYVYLRDNGQLMSETIGSYLDNGSYITTKIVSSWLQLAGIQGFQRFYKMLVLGSYQNKHTLRVKFAYDFNPSWVQSVDVDAGALLDPGNYGDGTYGADVYGGNYPLYQFDIRPKRQKCESFKFCIEDFRTSEDGEGFSLSNFAAEIGVKTGANKNKSSSTFGAS